MRDLDVTSKYVNSFLSCCAAIDKAKQIDYQNTNIDAGSATNCKEGTNEETG
jgi:hypothetical protein